MRFGEKLKKLRTEKKLTQEGLAKMAGISRRAYIAYEQDGTYPRKRETYTLLAQALGCNVNYLLTEDEEFVTQAAEQYSGRGKKQAEELVAQLSGLFTGGELSESDRDQVMIALQKVYFDCKADNKKYASQG